jgi:hypothetical protein
VTDGSGESFLGGQYSDDEWSMVVDLATRLGVVDQMHRETPRVNRDVLLDRLGYSPSWGIENGLMGLVQAWFTTCYRFGATVRLTSAEQGHLSPVDQHTAWHALLGGGSVS